MLCNSARLTHEIRTWSRGEGEIKFKPQKPRPILTERERENNLIKAARQLPIMTLQKMDSGSPIKIMTNTELEEECEKFHKSSRSNSNNSTQPSTPAYIKYRPSPVITKE